MIMQWKFIKTLENKDIIKLYEEKYQITFPKEFISLIERYNGGRPRPNNFNCKSISGCVFKSLLSFNPNDRENIFNTKECLKDELPENLIPFATDPAGNLICFKYTSGNTSIVYWMHETEEIHDICETINELLNNLY